MVLKEVNSIVTEPYMVCIVALTALISTQTCVTYRTNHSMYRKPKRTATANGPLGIQRLPLLLDCMSHPMHALGATVDMLPTDMC
jgi:hypothetical protein